MKMFRGAAPALLIVVALAACSKKGADATGPQAPAGPVAAVAPPPGQDWTQVTAATAEGGMRMGNPNAPVKLVEYASLTCPHCRDFTAEAADPLRNKYIKTGKVSWEYRPFLLNGLDTAAFLLARCGGAATFFPLAEQTYQAQNDWLGKYVKLTAAQQNAIAAMDPSVQFKRMAELSGLDGFYRARGLPTAKADQCLSDVKAAEELVKIRDHATNDLDVSGTPTFFVNGTLWSPTVMTESVWPQLDRELTKVTG